MTPSETTASAGLTDAEVRAAMAAGRTNATSVLGRKTTDVIRDNILTPFNALLGTLLVIAIAVAPPQDALFGFVIAANSVIGIAQELRAKRTLDRLRVLTMPNATVRRSGEERTIAVHEIVLGDHVLIGAGDQVPVDGVLAAAEALEVDESLLTGESEPVGKRRGDHVRSGSVITAGSATVIADAVGEDSYAQKLTIDARRFTLARSEIRDGIDRILRALSILLVPVGALTVIGQFRVEPTTRSALAGTVAALVGMVPEGLVLLTSVAFAAGVIRIGKRGALVQELAALEGLARVDVVCLDKTGTLTSASMRVASTIPFGRPFGCVTDIETILGALAAADTSPNASARAIAAAYPSPGWVPTAKVAFTSARRWSGVTFEGKGSFVLGAPAALVGNDSDDGDATSLLDATVRAETDAGRRTLVLGEVRGDLVSGDDGSAPRCSPIGVVSLREEIRPDAAEMVRFFTDAGVTTLVLSGDDPRTVGSIAAAVGVPEADHPASGADLPGDPAGIVDFLTTHRVIGRVDPAQKLAVIRALQGAGHSVAMTGDGVNDVPALKQANIGVAMRTGSGAARAVARVVMTGDSFAPLPDLVHEGRRVLANMERVASLFLTKTVYAIALAVAVTAARLPYPLLPRQLTLISTLTIGLPGFLLSLLPANTRPHHRLVEGALRRAIPAGLLTATGVIVSYTTVRATTHVERTERSAALVTAIVCGLVVLLLAARPLDHARRAIVALSALGAASAFAIAPVRRLLAIEVPWGRSGAVTAATSAVAAAGIVAAWQRTTQREALRSARGFADGDPQP